MKAGSTKQTILLLEDDADLSDILGGQLTQAGFVVQSCDKISDAVFKLRNQTFDCLVMDIKVKQGDSTTILETIRNERHGRNFQTPVVLISGNFSKSMIGKMAPYRPSFLVKPFDGPTLINRVKELIKASTEQQRHA